MLVDARQREAEATLGELGRRSQEISAVLQMIRKIADQTNRLTLDAAIKAARVAGQGSLLADRTGQVSGEIDARTCEVIAAVGSISIAINEQCIASQTIAQGVEKIFRMAEAKHSTTQATTVSAQSLRDRTARLDKPLAHFRVA